MDYSAANTQLWTMLVQIGIIAFMLVISNIIRQKVPLIKKTLMPTSVIAGFLLLLVKSLGWLPVDSRFLEMVTYHGIAIGFIALSLKIEKKENCRFRYIYGEIGQGGTDDPHISIPFYERLDGMAYDNEKKLQYQRKRKESLDGYDCFYYYIVENS